MVMGLIGGAIGLGAAAGANALGIGKNDTRARTYAESQGAPGGYDPNAFQYGGAPGGANAAAQQYGLLASQAHGAQAPQAAQVGVDYSGGNGYQAGANQAVGGMNNMAGLMALRANGQVPSIAQQQANLQMGQATAAQASAAASARGAGGLALAQQNAANNTATMQSAISSQAQVNAANERMQAEQNAYNAYGGIQGANFAQQQQAANQAQFASQLGVQQNQFNANMQNQAQQANNQYSLGLYGLQNNVQNNQLSAGIQQQNLLGNNFQSATNANVGISQYNAGVERGYYNQALGAAQGGLDSAGQMGLGGGSGGGGSGGTPPLETARANGGPVMAGRPYLVGERGPELIIPQQSGTVLPAEHPMSRMATMSDDRAKFGISPLGLLGIGGGNAASGPGVAGTASPEYAMTGTGGMDVNATSRAEGLKSTGYMSDPSGGMMAGGLLSDDAAKEEAYDQGAAAAAKYLGQPEMPPWDEGGPTVMDEVQRRGGISPSGPNALPAPMPPPMARPKGPTRQQAIASFAGMRSAGLGHVPDSQVIAGNISRQAPAVAAMNSLMPGGASLYPMAALGGEAASGMDAYLDERPHSDPVTTQLATGLAPIRFQYKPGMGPPGPQTGIRAQGAATQPITSSMVQQRPDGLLSIDPQMGLGTALAGVGHLSRKQQENETKLNGLLAMSANREGY